MMIQRNNASLLLAISIYLSLLSHFSLPSSLSLSPPLSISLSPTLAPYFFLSLALSLSLSPHPDEGLSTEPAARDWVEGLQLGGRGEAQSIPLTYTHFQAPPASHSPR